MSLYDMTDDAESGSVINVFDLVPSHRPVIEQIVFVYTMIVLATGASSAIVQSPTGLSLCALGLVVNFVLAATTIPMFSYSLRFILDAFLLYLALVLRSKLIYQFLVLYASPHTI